MNTIKEFLQGYEASTVKDVAEHGIESGAIGELIYTEDVVAFFNSYYSDIEAVILDYVEDTVGDKFYDLANMELLETLNDYFNVDFTTTDEMLELLHEEAFKQAEEDNADEWDDLDEDEIEELVFEAMDSIEVLPTKQDKLNFVALAVEIVAQQMQEG